jgi:glycosyltransferase involved in cell wall biosynthesis
MDKISAIVIAKDSDKVIEECLKSLKFCDEIIVIDAGSRDKTKSIAEKFGAKVLNFEPDDYAGSRNFGLKAASNNWILYVDTDERVSQDLAREIKREIKNTKYNAFKLRRKNFYLGKNEWPKVEKLERLFKKDHLRNWYGKIHESPVVEGKIGTLKGFLYHYTHQDLTSMLNKTIEWSKIEADLRFKANHPKMNALRFIRVMTTAFLNSYIKQGGFRVGIAGLVESIYQSYSIFVTYARLWEMQNKK